MTTSGEQGYRRRRAGRVARPAACGPCRTWGGVASAFVASSPWLLSAGGLAHLDRATAWLDERIAELTVQSRLRDGGLDPERARLVLSCARARIRAREVPGLDDDAMVFTMDALEQSSPPLAARWRARRFE